MKRNYKLIDAERLFQSYPKAVRLIPAHYEAIPAMVKALEKLGIGMPMKEETPKAPEVTKTLGDILAKKGV